MGEVKTYTYRTAAKRVNRSDRTIRHWREWGMPMGWAIIEGQRTRVVEEEVLLAHWRLHMKNDPAHQNRLRAKRRAAAAAAQSDAPSTPARRRAALPPAALCASQTARHSPARSTDPASAQTTPTSCTTPPSR